MIKRYCLDILIITYGYLIGGKKWIIMLCVFID